MIINDSWINPSSRIRSGWKPERFIVRKLLTDKQIEKYRRMGFYSAEFKQARKELQDMRKRRRDERRRDGNFVRDGDRLIFSPL